VSSDQELVKLAFVCTGNSARSQMAEGIAGKLAADNVVVQSAGTRPGAVSQFAIAAMKQIDIDISTHRSKGLEELYDDLDYIITVCDNARQHCPAPPANCKHIHWSIPDPVRLSGSNGKILTGFTRAGEKLYKLISEFLDKEGLLKAAR